MVKIRVQFNKGGLCSLILFSAHKQEKKKKIKNHRSVKSKMPLPSAVPGAAAPSTAGKHGCSLCPCVYEHKQVFYVISSIQILPCSKTGTLDARVENQPAPGALHAQGWGWAGAGTGALVGLGGMWCREVSWNHLFQPACQCICHSLSIISLWWDQRHCLLKH